MIKILIACALFLSALALIIAAEVHQRRQFRQVHQQIREARSRADRVLRDADWDPPDV